MFLFLQVLLYHFNSIKVRLKLTPLPTAPLKGLYFNSIKVRLKLEYSNLPIDYITFQFHKGTIKTLLPFFTRFLSIKFQFHKGTIKTIRRRLFWCIFWHFNSIKVRLKLSLKCPTLLFMLFQFHKGTIKTGLFSINASTRYISIP